MKSYLSCLQAISDLDSICAKLPEAGFMRRPYSLTHALLHQCRRQELQVYDHTEPHRWYRNALIWETASPYLYLRTTKDNRILIGGKDDDFSDARLRNKALRGKARALEAAFASTKDGLPYIGSLPDRPHVYFALGFGGNGITFSVLAAQIITNMITGKKDGDAALFGFDR